MAKEVVVNLKGLERFQAQIELGLRGTAPGPMRAVLKQWAAIYRSAMQLRFNKFSRGGGNWAPLKPVTVAARRKGRGGTRSRVKGGITATTLIDTGLLRAALQPVFVGTPGALEKQVPFGIRVGYGGPDRHAKGKASIAAIARFHQTGSIRTNLPKREIIVAPSMRTIALMVTVMKRKLQDMIDGRA